MQDLTLSLAVLATVALVWGGIWMIRKGGDRKKGALMIAAALVLLGNILIVAWPAS
jgi:hypothetical protein